jgi:hypothetical protein
VTKHIGAVLFEDATRLYLIYDGMADVALRPLFPSEKAAQDWLAAGAKVLQTPPDADMSEEAVTVIADVSQVPDRGAGSGGGFASLASKQAMWLTGPRSFLELIYENGATASREF